MDSSENINDNKEMDIEEIFESQENKKLILNYDKLRND